MEKFEPKPATIFMKGLEIFRAISSGNATVRAIVAATGLPATTVLRIAPLLVEDQRVEAKLVGGELILSVRLKFNVDAT